MTRIFTKFLAESLRKVFRERPKEMSFHHLRRLQLFRVFHLWVLLSPQTEVTAENASVFVTSPPTRPRQVSASKYLFLISTLIFRSDFFFSVKVSLLKNIIYLQHSLLLSIHISCLTALPFNSAFIFCSDDALVFLLGVLWVHSLTSCVLLLPW